MTTKQPTEKEETLSAKERRIGMDKNENYIYGYAEVDIREAVKKLKEEVNLWCMANKKDSLGLLESIDKIFGDKLI